MPTQVEPAVQYPVSGTATAISVPVTPVAVTPPLSPSKIVAWHGGDMGSSIWRGGSPTHERDRATRVVGASDDSPAAGVVAAGATVVVVERRVGVGPPPERAASAVVGGGSTAEFAVGANSATPSSGAAVP